MSPEEMEKVRVQQLFYLKGLKVQRKKLKLPERAK